MAIEVLRLFPTSEHGLIPATSHDILTLGRVGSAASLGTSSLIAANTLLTSSIAFLIGAPSFSTSSTRSSNPCCTVSILVSISVHILHPSLLSMTIPPLSVSLKMIPVPSEHRYHHAPDEHARQGKRRTRHTKIAQTPSTLVTNSVLLIEMRRTHAYTRNTTIQTIGTAFVTVLSVSLTFTFTSSLLISIQAEPITE